MDDTFYEFSIFFAKVLINNSYFNEKTYGIPSNIRKIKISHILETTHTHSNNYYKKGFSHRNIYTKNTSVIGQNVKNYYKHISHLSSEHSCEKSITLCMLWRNVQAIM